MRAHLSRHRLAAVGVALLLAYAPLLFVLIRDRWRIPHSQFTPLLLLAAAALAWSRRELITTRTGPAPRLGAALLGVGAGLLAVGVVFYSPWFAMASLPLALLGLATVAQGRAAIARYGPVALLLACAIPLPMSQDQRLIDDLQRVTSRVSSALLDLAGVPHLMAGNVLEFPGKRLLVEEACSGVQSLFALVAAVAVYLVWRRRPWSIAAVLLPAAVGAAVLMNVARVTAIALADHRFGLDLSKGWPHEVLGTVSFALALVLLAAVEAVAGCVLGPITLPRFPKLGDPLPEGDPDGLLVAGRILAMPGFRAIEVSKDLCRWWNRAIAGAPAIRPDADASESGAAGDLASGWSRFALVPVLLFAILALVQTPMTLALARPLPARPDLLPVSDRIAAWDETTLPAELRAWRQVGFEKVERTTSSDLGEHSTVWRYQAGGLIATLSCDYPFGAWHELSRCYRNAGWTLLTREVVPATGPAAAGAAPFVVVTLSKPTGETGLLCFALIDHEGQPVPIPEMVVTAQGAVRTPLDGLTNRFRKRWLQSGRFDLTGDLTYQLQAFVAAPGALPPAARAELQAEFVAMRSALLARLAERSPR